MNTNCPTRGVVGAGEREWDLHNEVQAIRLDHIRRGEADQSDARCVTITDCGDTIIIEYPGDRAWCIDVPGGGVRAAVIRARMRAEHPAAVVTHYRRGHSGGSGLWEKVA